MDLPLSSMRNLLRVRSMLILRRKQIQPRFASEPTSGEPLCGHGDLYRRAD